MNPELPDNLARAVNANPDQPLRTESSDGKVIWLVTDANLRSIVDENTRAALRIGLDAIESGDVDEWSVEDVKKQGRARLADQG